MNYFYKRTSDAVNALIFIMIPLYLASTVALSMQKIETTVAQTEIERIEKILGDEYEQFVQELGENIKDPKFLAVLVSGDALYDKVPFEHNVEYTCSQLIPTQSEIDVDKSLAYPLHLDPYGKMAGGIGIPQYLKGGSFAPGGPIVTAGGKYIIDGHHRWSQLYLINPDAKIKAINMMVRDPIEALKITQMAIAAITKKNSIRAC